MKEGRFDFDIDKCVACFACVAACRLENNGEEEWRQILSCADKKYPGLPVHNISIACNHCEKATCMEGCPAKAYYRDPCTDAVLIDEKKCIACNYCYWNCPYNAPSYKPDEKTMTKCTMCFERLKEDLMPACVTACPTGALNFLEKQDGDISLLKDTGIKPRLVVKSTNKKTKTRPRIIGRKDFNESESEKTEVRDDRKVTLISEWSLLIFTFMSSLLFAFVFNTFFGTGWPGKTCIYIVTLLVLAISVMHLGRPFRAWRAISNIAVSPLSNEIAAVLVFIASAVIAFETNLSFSGEIAAAAGVIMLILIDGVYTYSDPSKSLKYHPGQTFLSGLFIASLLSGRLLPLIFTAIIKLFLSLLFIYRKKDTNLRSNLRFAYSIVLTSLVLIILIGNKINFIHIFVLSANEFMVRLLFYLEFSPTALKKMLPLQFKDH